MPTEKRVFWKPTVTAMGETDSALVDRVRRGDGKAFDQLVRRHLRSAHAVARSRLANDSEADDVCQDAFIKALESIDRCEKPEQFRAWLLAIVRNTAHNRREYNKVRDTAPMEAASGIEGNEDPAEDLRRARIRDEISGAMEALTELQRSVLVLHDMEGWKHAEIGQKLGISAGSSRVHLHVARRSMRKSLTGPLALGSL